MKKNEFHMDLWFLRPSMRDPRRKEEFERISNPTPHFQGCRGDHFISKQASKHVDY